MPQPLTPRQRAVWVATLLVVITSAIALPLLIWISQLPPTPGPPVVLPTPTMNPLVRYQYHTSRGQFQQALYQLEMQAQQTGWTSELHRRAGDLWREMGDTRHALAHWQRAAGNDATLLRQMAAAYLQLEQWGEALDTINRLLAIVPDDAWGNTYAGLILAPSSPPQADYHLRQVRDDARYRDIVRPVSDIIIADPDSPALATRIGAALADQREFALAEQAFRYSAAVYHPQPDALAYVGLMRDLRGQDGGDWVDLAVRLAPEDAEVRSIAGIHYRIQRDPVRSIGQFRLAITLDPTNPVYYAELGGTYHDMGDLDEAEYWLQVAVTASDNAPLMQEQLSDFYAQEARLLPQTIIDNLARGATDNPGNPAMVSAYAWALHSTGNTDLALTQIEEALKIAPNDPRVLYDKARILLDVALQADAATSETSGNAVILAEAIALLEQVAASRSAYAADAQRLLDRIG